MGPGWPVAVSRDASDVVWSRDASGKDAQAIEDFQPSVVVLDPVTSFLSSGTSNEVKGMLTRLIDFLKSCEVTALMTTLSSEVERLEQTDVHVSSLIDTWLVLRDLESGGDAIGA